ncbi:putative glycosyl transferase [Leclercia adecarboxylata]|uniref:Putative glycosyl transferase n=1 Tax=Leclercia adecarboxylata TaxID=83655 RepID=A0A4U9HDU4_9ENTR|nr:putative glycosyl transferase [Leclercia adecarboxylata]
MSPPATAPIFMTTAAHRKKIFPSDKLASTGVLDGPEWLQMALASRKFLHVTWLNIYRHAFIKAQGFTFEHGLRHQDIPWTTEVLLTAKRVQYVDEVYYGLSDSLCIGFPHARPLTIRGCRSSRHYMKILEMLDAINKRYPEQVEAPPRPVSGQIAKEGLGILHSINNIEDSAKKREITPGTVRSRHLVDDLAKRAWFTPALAPGASLLPP